MLQQIETHDTLLINSIGHSIGLLLFAGFLILFLRDRRQSRTRQSILPAAAAALALLWNAGSLYVLGASAGVLRNSDVIASLSFAVLSLLPATLLQLSVEGRVRPIWVSGYCLSGLAVGLHAMEWAWPGPRFHHAALWLVIFGFGALTVAAMFVVRGGRRMAMSMCLFLFAISFAHFSSGHVRDAWSSEIAIHHAGIPLALLVLSQDYRFLLLDAFVRFLAGAVTASGFVVLTAMLNSRFRIVPQASENPFVLGLVLVAACMVLMAVVFVRGKLQLALTRVVFGRPDREPAIRGIREAGSAAASEAVFLQVAGETVARFMRANPWEVRAVSEWPERGLPVEPGLVTDAKTGAPAQPPWAQACVPVRFMKGDGAVILLGRREGGRRYLSEDFHEAGRLAAVVAEQVERFRSCEFQRLVSQAELRALQSQINPHFLFNSLNTLYGSIPRESAEARRMVLNLAEIFRYSLRSDRALIRLSEEVRIVQAYVEIEALRLGDKLRTEIAVDERAGHELIPILSIQPLVENAVRHGIAQRPEGGTVRLSARAVAGGVRVEVTDDGAGFGFDGARDPSATGGVGLENVRQRLLLSFGGAARLRIDSTAQGSTVSFLVPARSGVAAGMEVPA